MSDPDLGLVNRLGRAFWSSAVLSAAVRLDIFTPLAEGPAQAPALAARLGADARYMQSLLDVCAALGLVERGEDGRYANTPTAAAFLVRGRPTYQGDMAQHRADLWAAWDRLDTAMRQGAPIPNVPEDASAAEAYWRHYIVGHHQLAQAGQAAFLVEHLDLTQAAGSGGLLDVGGGAGSYTIALCQRQPHLHGTVLDQPEPLRLARALVDEAGLAGRIKLVPGDYHTADFGSGRDAVLFSAVLCQESADDCQALLQRATAALRPGGVVAVQDAMDFGEPSQRETLAVFDLLLLLLYNARGAVRTQSEVVRWLQKAGLEVTHAARSPGLFNLLVARKS